MNEGGRLGVISQSASRHKEGGDTTVSPRLSTMMKKMLICIFVLLLFETALAENKPAEVPIGDSPAMGPADAPVTVIEFIDFQCPHCVSIGPIVKKIMQTYPDKIRLIIKNFPYKNREHARLAAEASLAARDQDKYWEMHDILITRSPQLDRTSLIAYARELGLDVAKFTEAIDHGSHAAEIDRDLQLARSIDLYNTPTFYINGRQVVGKRHFHYFQKLIDQLLRQATN